MTNTWKIIIVSASSLVGAAVVSTVSYVAGLRRGVRAAKAGEYDITEGRVRKSAKQQEVHA